MGLITLDSQKYPVDGYILREPFSPKGFPDPSPESGEPSEKTYTPVNIISQTSPLGIGLLRTYQEDRVWDMEADARFPSGIYPPRLITSTTFPGEVAAVQFHGFEQLNGDLFMFGKGTSTVVTADEACLYFDGANWADTTTKDDINDDGGGGAATGTHIVSSMTAHVGRTYQALIGTLTTNAASGSAVIKIVRSDVGSTTAWTADGLSTSATSNGMGNDTPYGLKTDGDLMYCATWDGTDTISIRESPTGNGGVVWNGFTANPTILSSRAPVVGNAAVMYGDGTITPVLDYWLGTAEGLIHVDISAETFEQVVSFQHPQSSFSGTLVKAADGLLFTDGPQLFFGRWENGVFVFTALGPEGIDDGVPLEQLGDIQWVSYDNTLGEVAIGKGGLAADRNQVIYIGNLNVLRRGDTSGWRAKMGRNTTANRQSFGGGYSSETDGINRLHFARDNGTSNDSEALYLNYISENPDVQTAATFFSGGTVTTSWYDGGVSVLLKGWFKGRYRADDLTSTETLGVKFAFDNGTLGSSQSITSGPVGSVWTDGAGAVGTSGRNIQTEITMARGSTTTTRPAIRSIGYAFMPKALKDDGTPLISYKFTISRDPTRLHPFSLTPEKVLSSLDTSFAKLPLVPLTYDEGKTSVSTSVVIYPYKVEQKPADQGGVLDAQSEYKSIPMMCVEVI